MTRCSAARLAHLSGGQGVASSNLAIPTEERGEPLTKKILKDLFVKVSMEKIHTSKMIMSSGLFASVWGSDIEVSEPPEILTEEEKLERRIVNRGW